MTFRACILAVPNAANFDFSVKVLDFSFLNLNAKPAVGEQIILVVKNLDNNTNDLYYYTIKKIISQPIYKNFDFSKYLKTQPYINKKVDFYIVIEKEKSNLQLISELNEDNF